MTVVDPNLSVAQEKCLVIPLAMNSRGISVISETTVYSITIGTINSVYNQICLEIIDLQTSIATTKQVLPKFAINVFAAVFTTGSTFIVA